jgi:hypothetical protein
MRVRLKKMDVFWLKASSFFRQLREVDSNRPNLPTRDREIGSWSSFRPRGWPQPPFLACEM